MGELLCNCRSALCDHPDGTCGKPVEHPYPAQMYDQRGAVGEEQQIGICEDCLRRNLAGKGA
jgi:hypothetical protein